MYKTCPPRRSPRASTRDRLPSARRMCNRHLRRRRWSVFEFTLAFWGTLPSGSDSASTSPPWQRRLFDEGVYRNQFETGLSSGSLSAFPAGARDTWENTLFGGAYHTKGVTVRNARNTEPWSSFATLMARSRALDRATSCFGQACPCVRPSRSGQRRPAGDGTPRSHWSDGTRDERFIRGNRGGRNGQLAVAAGFRRPRSGFKADRRSTTRRPQGTSATTKGPGRRKRGRVLDTQIEAQVHGPIDLSRDVELLVADLAFAAQRSGRSCVNSP